jgi:hypothetical protein
MTEDNAFRGLLTSPPTYLQRDGDSVCTTCGTVVGGNSTTRSDTPPDTPYWPPASHPAAGPAPTSADC